MLLRRWSVTVLLILLVVSSGMLWWTGIAERRYRFGMRVDFPSGLNAGDVPTLWPVADGERPEVAARVVDVLRGREKLAHLFPTGDEPASVGWVVRELATTLPDDVELRREVERAIGLGVEPGARSVWVEATTSTKGRARVFAWAAAEAVVASYEEREVELVRTRRDELVEWVAGADREIELARETGGAAVTDRVAAIDAEVVRAEAAIAALDDRLAGRGDNAAPKAHVDLAAAAEVIWNEPTLWGVLTLAGLAFGLFVVFADEFRRWRAVDPAECSRRLGLPLVATFPIDEDLAGFFRRPVLSPQVQESASDVAEFLRAGRDSSETGIAGVAAALSSARSGEGRTTIIASLAMVLAEAGYRVTLVDGAVRSPGLHVVLGLHNDVGVVDLMASLVDGQVDPVELRGEVSARLQSTLVPGLRFLAAGPTGSPRVPFDVEHARALMDALRADADFVLCDTRAVNEASLGIGVMFDTPDPRMSSREAVVLAAACDTTLIVVDPRQAPSRQVLWARRQLREAGARASGVVVNRAATPRESRTATMRGDDAGMRGFESSKETP